MPVETSKTILLVEDEALIALNERAQLERAGYRVLHAPSGEEAVDLVAASAGDIDLVLMDIDLGAGIDGTEAARQILRRSDLPVLFLSSHMESELVEKTEEIANYGYVVKSSVFTVLHASIKMAFKLFEARRRLNRSAMELEAANEELRVTLEDLQTAHAKLAVSEDKFSRAFHLNPDSININRLSDGVYLDVNEGFVRTMGYAREEVIGRSSLPGELGVWVHPEDRERLVRGLEAGGEVANLEAEFRKKDGSTGIGLMSARVMEIDGQACIISITREISEQKRAHELVERSQLLLTSIIESPRDISIVSVDRDYNFLFFNHAYRDDIEARYGRRIRVGMNLREALPADPFIEESIDRFARALQGEAFRVVEHDALLGRHHDGYYSPIPDGKGSVLGATAFVVLRNAAEGGSAEEERHDRERYQGLLMAMGEGFAHSDGENRFVFTNPSAERIFGVAPGGLLGRSVSDFLDEEGKALVETETAKRKLGKTSTYALELSGGDGERRTIRVNASPVFDLRGRYLGSSTVFSDISDQKRAEEALKAYARNKELLMKELQHRVKNSLGIVSSLISLAKAEAADSKARAILDDTQVRIESLGAVYERLYHSESLDSLDLGSYIEDLGRSIADTYTAAAGSVRVHISVAHPQLDTKRAISVGLILNELLTNALKYAYPVDSAGEIRIELAEEGDTLRLSVSDDGVGLGSPDRIKSPTTMGMMLIRELARQIEGSLEVETGAGTTISLGFELGESRA